MTSLFLQQHSKDEELEWNFSLEHEPVTNQTCGFHFCNDPAASTATEKPPERQVRVLLFVFVGLDLLAIALTSLFVRNHPHPVTSRPTFWNAVTSTLKLHKNKLKLGFIPLYVYTGLEQAFLVAEFTEVRSEITVSSCIHVYIRDVARPFWLINFKVWTNKIVLAQNLGGSGHRSRFF